MFPTLCRFWHDRFNLAYIEYKLGLVCRISSIETGSLELLSFPKCKTRGPPLPLGQNRSIKACSIGLRQKVYPLSSIRNVTKCISFCTCSGNFFANGTDLCEVYPGALHYTSSVCMCPQNSKPSNCARQLGSESWELGIKAPNNFQFENLS